MSDEKVSPVDPTPQEDTQSLSSVSAFSPWHSNNKDARESTLNNQEHQHDYDEDVEETQGN